MKKFSSAFSYLAPRRCLHSRRRGVGSLIAEKSRRNTAPVRARIREGRPRAGSGDTAYTFGNIDGNEDGSGALTGDNNYAGMFGGESAIAGSSATVAGSNDLAEVLFTHGNAAAQGADFRYDIISLFGHFTG